MSLLKKAYHPETFKEYGEKMVTQIHNHLTNVLVNEQEKVISWKQPNDELAFWKNHLKNAPAENTLQTILEHSIHLHHPRYIGHQVCPPLPIASASSMLSSTLNNGSAVYEMGMASSAIEKIIIEELSNTIGYSNNAGGILTSGGTLANLTAMLAARKVKSPNDIWKNGHQGQLAIMVSEEAHYCVDRAARIMGLGDQGIIKIPVTKDYQIDINALEQAYLNAKKNNVTVIAVVGSAPSTSTGIFDDLNALGKFCKKNNLWFHVDGAHGGATIYSKKYKHLVSGIELADSVVIDGHKMLMMPSLTTALIFKNGEDAHKTFKQKADYLLEQSEDEDWYNVAKRTFECTKNMMSIHWYVVLKTYGKQLFDEYVTTVYDKGKEFNDLLIKNTLFETALPPMSNIICFRYKKTEWNDDKTNQINLRIRERILEIGEFYIVQTKLKGKVYLRITIMNPFTNTNHFEALLNHITTIAKSIENEF